jgi:ribosomal protein RSM22 (predicted rRNA methylase)
MTWTVPAAIEDALWDAARAHLPPEIVGGAGLTAAVVDRSRRYTSERERLSQPASAVGDLAARALFFTVVDAAKILVPLAELASQNLLPRGDLVRIVDVGAGCGAMTLGALGALAGAGVRRVDVAMIDRDRAALAIAADAVRRVAAGLGIACSVSVRAGDVVGALDAGRADLVLLGSVLNELPDDARLPLIASCLAALAPGGSVIAIEPALRTTARDLHVLRDRVLDGGLAHVFAPCTRRGAPCPMLADGRDWCHEERPVELPPRTSRIAHTTGLRDGAMKFAYLVLRHGPEPLVASVGGSAAGAAERVVSQPLTSKGKHELYVCGDTGRIRLRLLRRSRTADNRVFERARRGDVLRVPIAALESGDVGAGDAVERLTPGDAGARAAAAVGHDDDDE